MEPVMFRRMTPEDADAVSRLVTRVFDDAIAPHYEQSGVREFHAYASPEAFTTRSERSHFVALAVSGRELLAVAEVRDNNHLTLFFVASHMQGNGLGRELLGRVIDTCLFASPALQTMTVHASPNSLSVYERLGFETTGPEQTINGIRFTPMALQLTSEDTPAGDRDIDLNPWADRT